MKKLPTKNSQGMEVWRWLCKNRRAMISLAILIILVLAAIFADVIADYQTKCVNNDLINKLAVPSLEHWFGTDSYGRDIFARIVHGTRIALVLGFGSTAISLCGAMIVGPMAAYFGGRVDWLATRVVDILMTIPSLLMALAIVAGLGTGLTQLVIALAISQFANFTRILRSAALSVVNQEYIEAAKALGANDWWIIIRYIVPNIISTMLIQGTTQASVNIRMGATLSFIGLGVQIPAPEWGAMLSESLGVMVYKPFVALFPAAALMITALAINTLGDCLRDAFDPKLKGKA